MSTTGRQKWDESRIAGVVVIDPDHNSPVHRPVLSPLISGNVILRSGPGRIRGISVIVPGKGVLVLRDLKTDALVAKVYPLATGGSTYRFTHRDGATRTLITNANTGWTNVIVIDTTSGQPVACEREAKTGAIRFPFTPGHNYRLSDGK